MTDALLFSILPIPDPSLSAPLSPYQGLRAGTTGKASAQRPCGQPVLCSSPAPPESCVAEGFAAVGWAQGTSMSRAAGWRARCRARYTDGHGR